MPIKFYAFIVLVAIALYLTKIHHPCAGYFLIAAADLIKDS